MHDCKAHRDRRDNFVQYKSENRMKVTALNRICLLERSQAIPSCSPIKEATGCMGTQPRDRTVDTVTGLELRPRRGVRCIPGGWVGGGSGGGRTIHRQSHPFQRRGSPGYTRESPVMHTACSCRTSLCEFPGPQVVSKNCDIHWTLVIPPAVAFGFPCTMHRCLVQITVELREKISLTSHPKLGRALVKRAQDK